MTLINANAILASGYFRQDILEAVLLVWGQGQRHVYCAYYQPQEDLAGLPRTFAFLKLLQKQDLFTVIQVSIFTGTEHLAQGVKQGFPCLAPTVGGSLG